MWVTRRPATWAWSRVRPLPFLALDEIRKWLPSHFHRSVGKSSLLRSYFSHDNSHYRIRIPLLPLVMESIYELARETCLDCTPLPSYFNIKMENFLFHTNLIRIFIYIIRMELFQKLKITNPRIKTRTPSWNREFRNYCLDCTPLPSYFNIKIENFLFHTNFIRIYNQTNGIVSKIEDHKSKN